MRNYNWNTVLSKCQLILIGWTLVLILSIVGCKNNSHTRGLLGGSHPPPPVRVGDPGGIPNIGNTCYMNSVLQIFKTFYSDSFEDALNNQNNTIPQVIQAGQALIDVIKDDQKAASKEEAKAFLDAIKIEKESLGLHWKDFRSHQDAQELLNQLSDRLNFPMATLQGFLTNPNTNEIRKLGPADHWSMLQVPLSGDSEETMQNLLDNALGEEDITDYKWNETDRKPTPVTKKKQLSNLNNLKNGMFPIHVKRFATAGGAPEGMPFSQSKIQAPITNSFNLVVIAEKCQSDSHEDISYTLAAFIEHIGSSPKNGHYVTYVKKGDKWTLYNDSKVTQVTAQEAEKAAEGAYLYFYKPAS